MSKTHLSESRRVIKMLFIAILGVVQSVDFALAQESTEQEQNAKAHEQMASRWKQMRAFEKIDGHDREAERVAQAILNYAEPTRDGGHVGSLWAWGTKGRPVALIAQATTPGQAVWAYELVALSEDVTVVMHDNWRWSPRSALKMTPFPDVPPSADNEAARRSQRKGLARRLAVSESYFGKDIALRLLPRSVYSYQDESVGLIDGALFIFANGTNPEAIAVIECRESAQGPAWSYGFLPLTGAAVTAQLDGQEVWSRSVNTESKAQELYSIWLETDEA